MKKTLLTLMLAATATVVGCKMNDKSHVADVGEVPANSFRVEWKRTLDMDEAALREMYVRGDALFVYDTHNMLYSIDRKSGGVRFISDTVKQGAPVRSPLVTKDNIVIPTETRLDFLDKRGFLEKSIDLKSPVRTGAVFDENTVYIGITAADGSGRLIAVDPTRPHSPAKWELKTAGPLQGAPAAYLRTIFAGSRDGKVYATTPDRTAAWSIGQGTFQSAGPIVGDITAEKSGVYVASSDSKLYCLDPKDGKIRWEYFAGSSLTDSPVVTGTSVYIHVQGMGIVAIAKGDGELFRKAKWAVKDAVKFLAEDDKYAILQGDDNVLMAVDKATGKFKFASTRNDFTTFAVNPVDGIAYVANAKGQILAGVAVSKFGSIGEMVFVEPNELQTVLASR